MKPTEIMTVADVAEYLKVNEKTVYRLVQSGELPAFKVAGIWRMKFKDLERWIETRKATPKKQEKPE